MLDNLLQLYVDSGIWGTFVLILEFILLPLGIAFMIARVKKRLVVVFLGLAMFPFLLGLGGTAYSLSQLDEMASTHSKLTGEPVSEEMLEMGKQGAWKASQIGLIGTIPLLIIGIANLIILRKRQTQPLS